MKGEKKMIVYHGSTHRFQKLKVGKSLVDKRSTLDNEGCGIYFSTNRSVAESYGPYIYTLDINEDHFKDFRKRKTCEEYVNSLCQYINSKTGVDIRQYADLDSVVKYAKLGGIAISGIGREVALVLDSTETFYLNLSSSKRERIYQLLRNYDRKHLDAYMFEYHIKDIGVIKNVSKDVVKIVSREQWY